MRKLYLEPFSFCRYGHGSWRGRLGKHMNFICWFFLWLLWFWDFLFYIFVLHNHWHRRGKTKAKVSDDGKETFKFHTCFRRENISVYYYSFIFRAFLPPMVPPKIPDGEKVDFDVSTGWSMIEHYSSESQYDCQFSVPMYKCVEQKYT